jgi:hypothetical protein
MKKYNLDCQLELSFDGKSQKYTPVDPRLEIYDGYLHKDDKNCKHLIDTSKWSGVECVKCGGWFCY